MSIYRKCRIGEWQLISSEVIDLEIAQTKNIQRLEQLRSAIAIAQDKCLLTDEVKRRVIELTQLGFKPFDAAHLASAEEHQVDAFLTTDDPLLKRAERHATQLTVQVDNPVNWLIRINQSEGDTSNDDTP